MGTGQAGAHQLYSHVVLDVTDMHVGAPVRLRRALLGLSEEKLGEAVGVIFQCLLQNEQGSHPIRSNRMHVIMQVLDVTASILCDDTRWRERLIHLQQI